MSVKSQSSTGASKIKRNAPSKVSDDGDDEVDDKGVIKRKSRNLSEKKRRDQFNILINELCSMVCTGKRKMDKSAVLKTAISFIRNHNQTSIQSHSQEVPEDWKPSFLSNEEFTHLMLEALDEFIIVFSATGKILYVSENITCLLGHAPNDLIGSAIFDLVWEEERVVVQSLLRSWASDEMNQSGNNKENHISLSCHLRRGNINNETRQEDNNYELVSFSGYYRMQGNPEMSSASRVSSSSWGDESKESAHCSDALSQYNGLAFVASARLRTPQLLVEMSIVDVSKSEFTSRHSLEWKFLFLDHRGPPIIGYLPFEVLGTSGYDYYHIDDLEKVSECHEALMQKGEVTSCCYRFLTKGQQWIWLKTKYYITYHQWYSKPEFIVCSHRVLSYNEVMGHNMIKLETDDDLQDKNTDEDISVSMSSSKSKNAERMSSNGNKPRKMSSNPMVKSRRLSEDDSYSNCSMRSSNQHRERSKSSSKVRNLRSHHHHQSSSNASEPESPSGKTPMLRPPYGPGPESASSQHSSRHASGSSRVGNNFSDTGSMSSTGSFQSAASQHSRHSDQSMHSLHSQQSHHSMQSVHSQQSQSVRSSNHPGYNNSVHAAQQHLHEQMATSQHQQQHHFSMMNYGQARTNEVDTYLTTSVTSPTSIITSAGHQFLQPRLSTVSAGRRSAAGNSTPAATSPNPTSSSSSATTFTYQIDSANLSQGVTLPVQRIIDGLPVVTLPGLVAHEPVVMTAAQKHLHEQLKVKHFQLQRQIAAQQEELRRVSEQLLLAQYGAWGPTTVLKMAVPYSSEGDPNSGNGQPTHALLSAGGLVTCLTTETPISLVQTPPQSGQSVTLSSGTPILVHSPEFHRFSPGTDTICLTTDSPTQQVLMKTSLQQENLVQLSQQDIQMLLAQSLFQDNNPSSSSTEYLP